MEKNILKRVISNLITNKTITVNYVSNKLDLSGDYNVLGIKKGRGKGGSMLAELRSITDNKNVVLSTKDSDDVLNIVVDGTKFGYETEADIPPVYTKDASKAITLKRAFKVLEKASSSNPMKIKLASTQVPELDGTHTIVSARQLRGRQGQVILTTTNGLEIWSYRHSGVIDNFELVS